MQIIVPTFTVKSYSAAMINSHGKSILTANSPRKERHAIMKKYGLTAVVLILLLMASCGGSSGQSSSQSYKDTKSIVLDVLKSDDAQDAIQKASTKNQDKTMKLMATGEGKQMQMAVKEILTGSDGAKLLEKTMTDPKFAGDFAKAIQQNNKQLQKDLVKDPEYQKSLLDLMHHPDYQAIVLNSMKGPEYRLMMMNIVKESLQSPMFRAQMVQLMAKAIEEQTKPKPPGQIKGQEAKGQKGKGGGGGDSEGGEGEGEGGGQGGGGGS
jgi:spore germination protein D